MRRALQAASVLVLAANAVALGADAWPRHEREVTASSTSTSTTTTVATAPPTTTTPVAPPPTPAPIEPYAARYAPEPIVTIGSIEIPKLGIVAPLGEGISLHNIDRGPSHWPGTALPGQNGNVVVAGHRVTHTRPFRNIDRLVEGDQVIFVVSGVRWTYQVTAHQVVTPKDVWIVRQTPEPTATLFACHPPGSARYRYVVRLALVR